jgi:hypothetical protein
MRWARDRLRLAFSSKAGYTAAPYNANRRRVKWGTFIAMTMRTLSLAGPIVFGLPPEAESGSTFLTI